MSNTTLYIPNFAVNLHTFDENGLNIKPFTSVDLKHMFESILGFGEVRIELIPQKGSLIFRSALVIFNKLNENENVIKFREMLNKQGYVKFCCTHGLNSNLSKNTIPNRLFGLLNNGKRSNFHLVFKVNQIPFHAANGTLNIHQLSEANEFLKNNVIDLEEKIDGLEEKVVRLELKNDISKDKIEELEDHSKRLEDNVFELEDKVYGLEDKVKELEEKVNKLEDIKRRANLKAFELKGLLSRYATLYGYNISPKEVDKIYGLEEDWETKQDANQYKYEVDL
jgi:hypothetical protein